MYIMKWKQWSQENIQTQMPRLKKERFNINNLNLHLEELENKKGKLNPSLAKEREIIKMGAEVRQMREKSTKIKSVLWKDQQN